MACRRHVCAEFFTGSLINRIGVLKAVSLGAFLQFAAVMVALAGTTLPHFWLSLFLLGIRWNFAFTGGTTLLTKSIRLRSEQVQDNDFIVFTGMAISSLFSGALSLHGLELGQYGNVAYDRGCYVCCLLARTLEKNSNE